MYGWDHSSQQLVWLHPVQWPPRQENTSRVPLSYGAARVKLIRRGSDDSSGHANFVTVVVVFGLVLGPGARTNPSQDPWCSLVKDDGVSRLEDYLASEFSVDESRREASLEFGPETVLNASIVPAKVNGREYGLIRLWVDKQPVDGGNRPTAQLS
jgi:hypothetical protein